MNYKAIYSEIFMIRQKDCFEYTLNKIKLILLFTFTFFSTCFGQEKTDTILNQSINERYSYRSNISILAGYNFWQNHYGELGLAYNDFLERGYHFISTTYAVSSEIKFHNKIILGPKIGMWFCGGSGGAAMGLNLVYYTDFNQSSLRIRPEVGFGVGFFKMVYGYNIALTNKNFEGINKSNFEFMFLIELKKLVTIEKE